MIGGYLEAMVQFNLLEDTFHYFVAELFHAPTALAYQMVVWLSAGHLIHFAACAEVAIGDEVLLG